MMLKNLDFFFLIKIMLEIVPGSKKIQRKTEHKPLNNENYSSSNVYSCNVLGQTEDVIMLLNFGVDPTVPDVRSRYVIDILKKNKNFDAVKAVSNHIEKHPSPEKWTGTTWVVCFSCFKILSFRCKIVLFVIGSSRCFLCNFSYVLSP